MTDALGFYKNSLHHGRLLHNLVFVFQVENESHEKKWKHQISPAPFRRFSSIFQHVFAKNNVLFNKSYWDEPDSVNQGQSFNMCLEKNNGLFNKSCWNEPDSINLGQSYGRVLQLCLYIGYHWTNFNQISTTM